jgi:hypothetical protein
MAEYRIYDFLKLLSVVHHIPGRVRLKLTKPVQAQQLGLNMSDLDSLIEALRKCQGVRSASVNKISLSCTIDYDPEMIHDEAWLQLVSKQQAEELHDDHSSPLLTEIVSLLG